MLNSYKQDVCMRLKIYDYQPNLTMIQSYDKNLNIYVDKIKVIRVVKKDIVENILKLMREAFQFEVVSNSLNNYSH